MFEAVVEDAGCVGAGEANPVGPGAAGFPHGVAEHDSLAHVGQSVMQHAIAREDVVLDTDPPRPHLGNSQRARTGREQVDLADQFVAAPEIDGHGERCGR